MFSEYANGCTKLELVLPIERNCEQAVNDNAASLPMQKLFCHTAIAAGMSTPISQQCANARINDAQLANRALR